jgi:hypothetical protein
LTGTDRVREPLRDAWAGLAPHRGRVAIVAGLAIVAGTAAYAFTASEESQSAKAELQFKSPGLSNFGSLGLDAPGEIDLTPVVLRRAADSAGISVGEIRSSTSIDRDPRSGAWTVSATDASATRAQEIAEAAATELRAKYRRLISKRAELGLRYLDFLRHRDALRRSQGITRASLRDDREALSDFRVLVEEGKSPTVVRSNVQASPLSAGALARGMIAALAGLFLSLLVIAVYDGLGAPNRGPLAGLRRGSRDGR